MIEQDGKVAIAYYQTIPHVIQVNGNEYAFVVKADICMAWILLDDYQQVLSITKTCCGNQKRTVYRFANESDVRRWTNGGGR